MRKSILLTSVGFFLGAGAPLGALFLRMFLSNFPGPAFLGGEFHANNFFYSYMAIGTCLVFAAFGFVVGRKEDALISKEAGLEKEVLTDPLTGLGNHRFLHDTFKIEFRRHLSTHEPISCLMMDLDRFKKINDTHGHPFGDYVLKHFSLLVKKYIRKGDVAARYGGEEFLCILPNCDKQSAWRVAERIRRETERYCFSSEGQEVKITVSVGVITSYGSAGLNYRHLINLADQALYEAKHKGRNQVIQTTIDTEKKIPGFNRNPQQPR